MEAFELHEAAMTVDEGTEDLRDLFARAVADYGSANGQVLKGDTQAGASKSGHLHDGGSNGIRDAGIDVAGWNYGEVRILLDGGCRKCAKQPEERFRIGAGGGLKILQ